MIRVLLAEDQAMVRGALAALLKLSPLAMASSRRKTIPMPAII